MYAVDVPTEPDQGVIVATSLFAAYYPGSAALILTPRCDIAQDKADFLTLCAVADPGVVLDRDEWKDIGQKRNQLSLMIQQRHARWHWLEPFDGYPQGAIADFQLLASVAPDAMKDVHILTGLASPWREHVNSRYAGYAGRVGVPDVPRNAINEQRDAILRSLPTAESPIPSALSHQETN